MDQQGIYIIAEIGVNHNGDIAIAKELITIANQAGADAVKFQTFRAESLSSISTPKTKYQQANDGSNTSHYEMLKRLELTYADFHELKDYCDSLGIDFISTPYDVEAARFLHEDLNVGFFKVASADIIDIPLLTYVASTGLSTILSTGMATIGEIEFALAVFRQNNNRNVSLLHCVSNYPCSDQSLNLNVIKTLKHVFQLPVGFSDHSSGFVASIAASALGACMLEKHITLSTSMLGPDHISSMMPEEFSQYVSYVRRSEAMIGSGIKEIQQEEINMRDVSRKSLHARININEGEILDYSHFCLKRPGSGLGYKSIEYFIGKPARKSVDCGNIINLDLA